MYYEGGIAFAEYGEDSLTFDLVDIAKTTEARPFIYSAYAQITINENPHRILTEQIANKSGGYGLMNIIESKKDSWLKKDVSDNTSWLLPITVIVPNSEWEKLWLPDDQKLIQWIIDNGCPIIETAVRKVMDEGIWDEQWGKTVFIYATISY